MYKGWEGTNVKSYNEFGNDPIKMCSKHKTRMKVDLKLNILELFFIKYIMICDGIFFVMSFLKMFGHVHIFFSPIVVCTHL
jgi:hypothetical protein